MVKMGNVWDRTTEFLGENLSGVLVVALVAILLPTALSSIVQPLGVAGGPIRLASQMLSIGLSILSLWGQLAIIALALDPAAGGHAARRIATRRLLPSIGVALVMLVGVVALGMPILVALVGAGFDMQAAMNGGNPPIPPGAATFVVFYALAMAAVILWLAARLSLVYPVLVAERRGLGTLARSFGLTRGIALKIIGLVLLFGIVATVAVMAAQTVFGSILQLLVGGDGPITPASVLTALIVAVVTTIFTVLAAAFTAKLYLAAHPAREATVAPA